ncbi:MAG: four helix bundle protein [Bacteroidota bacterium]
MTFKRFEEILAWQKAFLLTKLIYNAFLNSKDFGFKDQIQRASISIMNNIAEGYERKTNNEFKHFLYISKGSCGEVRSMLYIAKELNYLESYEVEKLHDLTLEISKMISGLIKAL